MIGKDEFIRLYQKYLDGQCSPEEIEMLEACHDEITMGDDGWNDDLRKKDELYALLQQRIYSSLELKTIHQKWYTRRWVWVAATILVIFSVGLGILQSQRQRKIPSIVAIRSELQSIRPGSNKAYLTMSNGSVITLNGAANGVIAAQAGMKVNKIREGLLKYTGNNEDTLQDAMFNLITTPRGGQYEVELADGTHVWLNSATSLKYPASFKGSERKVELSGEAYFEVAKNPSKPFLVAVNGVTVRVLGTHFNIMGYNDDRVVKTTLLEGSVRLSYNGCNALLSPGQQGALNDSQTKFNIVNVDVDDVVAWKNGFFAFDNEDIQTIMKRISRWYDVDVVFPDNFKRKSFGGTVSRFDNVAEVLKSLELTGSVHFKIEGRRIVVMP